MRAFAGILLCASLLAQTGGHPPRFYEKEVFIPWIKAAPQGLNALLVYAEIPGKRPIAILTHGTSRTHAVRDETSAWSLLPQALWFARRGWLVLAVVRRGYGRSGGEPDYLPRRCSDTDYYAIGERSAEDLRAAIEYAKQLPRVDPARIISVGVSSGGFGTVALTAKPPEGLIAGINFAGGRGSRAGYDVCNPGELVGAFRSFGKYSRTPMLWIYAENDKFFWPELARRFDAAFREGGGQEQFVEAPAVGDDGHSLFRYVSSWSQIVDDYLKTQNLVFVPKPLPAPEGVDTKFGDPHPASPPPGLGDAAIRAFQAYLTLGPHKAFATSESGHFGYSTAQLTIDAAKRKALEYCNQSARTKDACRLISIDGESDRLSR